MKSFDELNLSVPVARAIKELGYETPSPIQAQALPLLLDEPTDFIGLAATGTGKTAAFGVPMLESIDPKKKAVQCLVLCPTRELALQVSGQINLLGKYLGVRALPIYGGAGYNDQIRGLKAHAQIVVGTPGRLIDHLERKTLKLQDVKTLVLDEADEMISMGFKEDLERILETTPRETSNVWLFSATMSPEVRRVADKYLRKPKIVQVNKTEMLSTTVEQIYYKMNEAEKPENLRRIIDAVDNFYGLVFCQTRSLVTDVAQYLTRAGHKVDCLHGDKTQGDREKTMRAFRERKIQILVCTDVASRGLDVKDVTHVINYSIPRELDVYVHRIGRTARSGKSGIAISLVTKSHWSLIARLEQMTKRKMVEGKLPTHKDIAAKKLTVILKQFQAQKSWERVAQTLDIHWLEAIQGMSNTEIVAKFIALLSPELLKEEKKAMPLSPREESYGRRERPAARPYRDDRHPRSGSGKGKKNFRQGGRHRSDHAHA